MDQATFYYFSKELTEHKKEALYGPLIDKANKWGWNALGKLSTHKNPMVSSFGQKALNTTIDAATHAPNTVIGKALKSVGDTAAGFNNATNPAALVTPNLGQFMLNSGEGAVIQSLAKHPALKAYGMGVAELPGQVPFLSAPSSIIGGLLKTSSSKKEL